MELFWTDAILSYVCGRKGLLKIPQCGDGDNVLFAGTLFSGFQPAFLFCFCLGQCDDAFVHPGCRDIPALKDRDEKPYYFDRGDGDIRRFFLSQMAFLRGTFY